ncbi:hypothetical protein [Bradyrhizobium elkanii]|uniref:hypothetical protein n=1 Tax=Bradyrhizobium elkanii TaxID=29448 RepID=UPI0006842256|nr:hypothetical protein [Bradyrhizobium elkanii]
MIDYHDRGNAVSLTARACPHCGSFDPVPYRPSRKEQKRFRADTHNDNRIAIITIVCVTIGIMTGLLTGHGILY